MESEIKIITPDQIIRIVSEYFNVPIDKIMGTCRERSLIIPRHFVFYFLRDLTELGFKKIASIVGRDHSSVINGIRKTNNYVETSKIGKTHFLNLSKRFHSIFVDGVECKVIPLNTYQESNHIVAK